MIHLFKKSTDLFFIEAVTIGVAAGSLIISPIIVLDKLCKPFAENNSRVGLSHMTIYQ